MTGMVISTLFCPGGPLHWDGTYTRNNTVAFAKPMNGTGNGCIDRMMSKLTVISGGMGNLGLLPVGLLTLLFFSQ